MEFSGTLGDAWICAFWQKESVLIPLRTVAYDLRLKKLNAR
jgi:hypothetical protein